MLSAEQCTGTFFPKNNDIQVTSFKTIITFFYDVRGIPKIKVLHRCRIFITLYFNTLVFLKFERL